MSFVLKGQLLRRAKTFDGDRGLRRDGAQTEDIRIFVGLGAIALDREHPEHPVAGKDRNHQARLGCDQLPRLGPVQNADRWSLGGPSTDDLW